MAESKQNLQTITEAAAAVDALQLAVDTLGMIAHFGGAQGDWALGTLERIRALVVGDSPRLQPVEQTADERFEEALGSGRR